MKSPFREFFFEGKHVAGLLVAAATVAALLYMEVGAVGQSTVSALPPNTVSALPSTPQAPGDNPTTPAKVALGRLLFWDPLLSGPQDVACATCHHPQNGYAEDRDLSLGVTGIGLGRFRRQAPGSSIPIVKRNSPTVLNVAFNGIDESGRYDPANAPMFWDMRKKSLESQALEPLKSLEEMRENTYPEDEAVARVVKKLQANAEYRSLFAGAFGSEQPVNSENLGRAIAAFERTLLANNSPFDRYMRGDRSAMTEKQVRGMQRFEEIGCIRCHNGPMFSDYKLHVMGVPDNPALPASDGGAQKPPCPASPQEPRTAASRAACDSYAFRTASLRNLQFTFPYQHNGTSRTLSAVVGFYESTIAGSSRNPNVSYKELDPRLRELKNVDEEDVDLIEFLYALSDGSFDRTIPERVPSGLPVGGRIR
jgi:cytochrome c peroxidase